MRTLIRLTAILLASFMGQAQPQVASPSVGSTAQESTSTATGSVPISAEHHHHLVFENSYTRVWEVEVPAHESTLLHQHDNDYVYIVLGDADITNAVAGTTPVKLHLADTTVNFTRGPFAHVAKVEGNIAFHNVTIELLRPQGEPNKFYASLDAALGSAAGHEANIAKGVTLLETNEVRVFAAGIASGKVWSPPAGHDHLVVLPDRMRDPSAPKEANAPMFPAGMVNWVPSGRRWSVRNDSPAQMKVLVLEFKDSGAMK
jgi:hypothetical protein